MNDYPQPRYADLDGVGVSRETLPQLERYMRLLCKWQEKINLVGPATLQEIWHRHFVDSLQVIQWLPDDVPRQVLDFGSGAGFPGLIIALCTEHKVCLVDSNSRKAAFLRHVASELAINVQIEPARIETAQLKSADIITARAFAALTTIFSLGQKHAADHTCYCLLKGRSWREEVAQAQRDGWCFQCRSIPSITDAQGVLLNITEVQHVN